MAKKTYTVEETGHYLWSMVVEIDHSPKVDEMIEAMMDFHLGDEDLIDDANGDVLVAFLKKLAGEALQMNLKGLNTYGVVEEFNDLEGYCAMDGSHGILIKSVTSAEYGFEFEVKGAE